MPYTEEELEFITRTMKEQIVRSSEAAKKRGHKVDPRIKEAKLK